jgi:ketopantoate reductase
MKILIVGSGGIGGYFGARLVAGGSDVTFVARGAHLQAMRRDGLHVRSPLGDLHLRQIKTIETVSEASEVELVIVAVKLWDTEEVLQVSLHWPTRARRLSRFRTEYRRTMFCVITFDPPQFSVAFLTSPP